MPPIFELKHAGNRATLSQSDAQSLLKGLPSDSVDLLLTSPPYFVGKEYDSSVDVRDFQTEIDRLVPEINRVVKDSGSVCWQVGNHVKGGVITPLDVITYNSMVALGSWQLRNRIVWTFGHGAHAQTRFSGRHETILWFTKSSNYYFDLDAVRIPQKYPGKRHYKGPLKGQYSGNPRGKNPSDVWDIPNVKSRHPEKTAHPCQFPAALARRLILALCPAEGIVVDPYIGSGTTAVAALMSGRSVIGGDISESYIEVTTKRIRDFAAGQLAFRQDKPVRVPQRGESVSIMPPHFRSSAGGE